MRRGQATGGIEDLVDHLAATTALDRPVVVRVVAEVMEYFSESTTGFVRRRHRELHDDGLTNQRIFALLTEELPRWRVVPPDLTERQLRRMVYG